MEEVASMTLLDFPVSFFQSCGRQVRRQRKKSAAVEWCPVCSVVSAGGRTFDHVLKSVGFVLWALFAWPTLLNFEMISSWSTTYLQKTLIGGEFLVFFRTTVVIALHLG